MIANSDVAAGYTINFCYTCTVTPAGGVAPEVQKVKDNLKIVQNPVDCSSALVAKKSPSLPAIQYKSGGSPIQMITGYTEVFTHNLKTECPLTSCTVTALGCSGALPVQTYWRFDGSYRFIANSDVTAGFTINFCYSCSVDPAGDASPIKFDKNSLTIRAYADCSDALVPKTPSLSAIDFQSGGPPETKIANYEEVFTHSKKNDCPLSSCQLKATGCSDPLASQTNVVLGSKAESYKVTAKTSNPDGYSVEFCYFCSVSQGGGASSV